MGHKRPTEGLLGGNQSHIPLQRQREQVQQTLEALRRRRCASRLALGWHWVFATPASTIRSTTTRIRLTDACNHHSTLLTSYISCTYFCSIRYVETEKRHRQQCRSMPRGHIYRHGQTRPDLNKTHSPVHPSQHNTSHPTIQKSAHLDIFSWA